jgi:hypothetical protein
MAGRRARSALLPQGQIAVGELKGAGSRQFDRDKAGGAQDARGAVIVDMAADGFEQQKKFLGQHGKFSGQMMSQGYAASPWAAVIPLTFGKELPA